MAKKAEPNTLSKQISKTKLTRGKFDREEGLLLLQMISRHHPFTAYAHRCATKNRKNLLGFPGRATALPEVPLGQIGRRLKEDRQSSKI